MYILHITHVYVATSYISRTQNYVLAMCRVTRQTVKHVVNYLFCNYANTIYLLPVCI